MKLLFAYDGSACADAALEDLKRAGLPEVVDATVLSVADLWLLPSGQVGGPMPARLPSATMDQARATSAQMLADAEMLASRAADRIREYFPKWQVHTKSTPQSPAWAVILEAEEQNSDLIVVGSHGYSTIERVILGSVSQTVLSHAPCSVRVARGIGTESGRPLRILVGYDGSEDAQSAVRSVANRKWPAGTDIRIFLARNPSLISALTAGLLPVERTPTTQRQEISDRIDAILENAMEIVRQKSPEVTVSKVIKDGDPKRIILEEAENWGADAIFIGSRGLNRWERLLLGSVSTAVASRAQCTVEVVRPPSTS